MSHESRSLDVRSPFLVVALAVCAVLGPGMAISAQVIPLGPALYGQWSGPWDLDSQINDHSDQVGVPPGVTLLPWGEITHAATLPPPNDGYVLFWCERKTPCHQYSNPYFIEYETFLWHPRAPANVAAVLPVPTSGIDGEWDLFCGGHTFTRDGRLVSAGGQDHRKTCAIGTIPAGEAQTWGTTGLFLFDNVEFDPELLTAPAWHELLPRMQRARWYPTLTRDATGKITAWGHQFLPTGSGPETWFTRERFDIPDGVVGIAWDPMFQNHTLDYFFPSCSQVLPFLVGMRGYPRVEVFLDQSPMTPSPDVDLVALSAVPVNQQPPFGTGPLASYYLDLDACTTFSEVERWYLGTAGPPPIAFSVAHYVDMTGTAPRHVVYALGGDIPSSDDPGAPEDCLTFTNRVVKLDGPEPEALWKGAADGVPQLKYSRKHLQAAIGLDGAIYVVGGEGREDLGGGAWGTCAYVHHVERYRPPEIFATPSAQWKVMASQTHDRGHHSVAGVLQDGRIYSAGGDHDAPAISPGERSVEIYSPEYLFKGPQPTITLAPTEVVLGTTPLLQVEITGAAIDEFRVALVSPGTMTHGYNFSQRYVKLKVLSPPSGTLFAAAPASNSIQVEIPGDGHLLPPGYYLFTVVRENGVPSDGKWVKVRLP